MTDLARPEYGTPWASEGEIVAPTQGKVELGWVQEMMPFQWENYLQNRQDSAITYLLQKGIPEYSSTQEYVAQKSVVVYQGAVYIATQTVTGVLPTVTASWKRLSTISDASGVVNMAGGGTGASTAPAARINLGLGTIATAKAPTTNGVVVRSAADTLVSRSVTGTANNIVVTNGDGVAGNISINVGSNVALLNTDSSWTSTGSIRLPSGSTSQQGTSTPGRVRFNLETGEFHGAYSDGWKVLARPASAEQTPITDVGNFYTSSNVEGALQEVGLKGSFVKDAILSYPDYATAEAAAATLPDGQNILIEADETRGGRSTKNVVNGGSLVFVEYANASPNLVELGGIGDGVTDSTDAVVRANVNGLPIYVPPGEFVTTQKPTVSIEGPGEIIYKGIPYGERGAFTDNRYRKKVLMQVSDKFSASDALKAQYGYSYFYIRGAYLDEDAGLLFVANMPPRGGANDWGWYVVYDTATGQEITYFSAGEVFGKTFSIVYEDGGRYLYTTGPSQAPQKFNLTTLPTPGKRLVAVETFSNLRTSFISEFGGDFLCAYDYVTYNTLTGHVSGATLCGKNLAPKSTMSFPISLMGTSNGSEVTLPKCQGVALGAGYVFATFGTNYSVSSGSTYDPRTVQGVRRFTMSGELIDEGILHPQKFYEKLVAYGYTSTTRVEYEGASVCKSGRVISTVHFTASDVLIVEEFSEAPDALDFSDCADSHSYVGDVWIPKRTGISGAGITNPLDGSKLTNLGDIAKFMQTSLLYKVLFSTSSTGTTIYETDGVTALPGSTYVEMTRSSVNIIFVDLMYVNFSRRMSITTDGSTVPVQAELPRPLMVNYRAGFDNSRRAVVWGNAAPTTGDWVRGDVLYVLNPSPGGWLGFVCTENGTPGTWKRFGAIEA